MTAPPPPLLLFLGDSWAAADRYAEPIKRLGERLGVTAQGEQRSPGIGRRRRRGRQALALRATTNEARELSEWLRHVAAVFSSISFRLVSTVDVNSAE